MKLSKTYLQGEIEELTKTIVALSEEVIELRDDNTRLWGRIGMQDTLLAMHNIDYGTALEFMKDDKVRVHYFSTQNKERYCPLDLSQELYDTFDKSKVNVIKNTYECAVFEIGGTVYTLDKDSGKCHEVVAL